MNVEFTPAAQRAIEFATLWTTANDRDDEPLRVPEVLLGLLAEPECRAALLLAEVGVDTEATRRRFPELAPGASPDAKRVERPAPEWTACLDTAEALLFEYPRPLVLATEHLLLGIVAADNDVARWLSECGLSVEALEAEVHRLSGHVPGPLPIDTGDADALPYGHDELPLAETTPHEQLAALRAIDAAANRADEGLRVIEDYLRFVLDDRHLTAEIKQIRHELTAALAVFPAADRHAARDTQGDVGTDVTLDSEQSRTSTAAVAQASFKRVAQALRSLEEFSKTLSADAASRLEQLRYRGYTLERAVTITHDALERLVDTRLCVLVDGRESAGAFRQMIETLMSSGVEMIQLRDKQMSDRELVERARLMTRLVHGSRTLSIMNDRPDLAVLAGTDGVHVGQDELTARDARRIVGPRALVGVSTHSLEQARAAVLDGASYIGVGPTFASGTKQFSRLAGPELLRRVHAEVRLPAFAIGGISADNLADVLATGFTRVAVSGAVVGAADPGAAARALLKALRGR